MTISPNSRVLLHFELSLDSGDVIDSTFNKQPASFCMGDGSLLPDFEACLLGLEAGQEARFLLPPEQAFGMPNPANIQYFKRHQFAVDTVLEPGLVMNFRDPSGEIPGVIKSIDLDQVEVDFNHPLAGKSIHFRVHILQVEEAAA